MDIRKFWLELSRRHVVRAAVGHVVVFWLIAQVADVVLPYVGIIDQPVRWTVIAGIALFPVTVVVAWFFEHPWHEFTGRKIFLDVLVIAAIAATASSWVWRHLPRDLVDRSSIAVIPFTTPGGDTVAQTVSRALAYEVIGLLMKSRSIDVTAYESASSLLLSGLTATEIATRLGVDHVLTGTVHMNGDVMQIRAQLENDEGSVVWREELEEDLEHLFKAEEELADGIVGRLGTGDDMISIETLAAQRCELPSDPDALERYYTARHYLGIRNETNLDKLRESIALFNGLIVDYPDFAEAMSGLAWALHTQEYYDPEVSWDDNERRKLELAQRAYDLCGQLGEAMVFLPNEFDHPNHWISLDRQLRAAMEMQPDKSEMADKYIRLMREVGRLSEALRVARKNYEMNPLSVRSIKAYASALQNDNQLDRAEELQLEAAELGSKTPIFARHMKQMQACSEDLECVLDQLFEPLASYRDQLRVAYTTPETEQEARRAVAAANAVLEEVPSMINWFNASACWYDHLTPVFFTAWARVQHPSDWFWPNVWGKKCGNVWATREFRELMAEQGMLEYWREVAWSDYCQPVEDSFICVEPGS